MKKQTQLLSFEECKEQATGLADFLNIEYKQIQLHRFPDGESLVTLPPSLTPHIVIYTSLHQPNSKLIELILACGAAKEKGVSQITLVAPYLAYMRQDIENKPGEAVSQRIIGKLISTYIDGIVTVDPHLHRIDRLEQAYPLEDAVSLSANTIIGDYIKANFDNVMLLGPDGESEQWVSRAAQRAGCHYGVATKVRKGDRKVEITLPDIDLSNKRILLVDDMISTGGTLVKITGMLHELNSEVEAAIVTHCLCSEEDEQKLFDAGIKKIISTDSIPHHSNRIALKELLGNAVKEII